MSKAAELRTYSRADSVIFRKTNDRFGGLSNMAAGFPLEVNGIRILTAEALYQACRFPHKPEVQRLVIQQGSPMTAKMKSKPHRSETRSDWAKVRVNIMRWCLRVKLAQNWQKFGELLLATGNRPIVEESRKDDFWGARAADEETLVGVNALGRLLMELREELQGPKVELLKRVEPPSIQQVLLYGQPIGIVEALGGARPDAELFSEPIAVGDGTTPPLCGHDSRKPVDTAPRPSPRPGTEPIPLPEPSSAPGPGLMTGATTKTLRLVGTVPPEVWSHLGTKILPRLQLGSSLRIGLEFIVKIEAETAGSLAAELQRILQDLGLDETVRVEEDSLVGRHSGNDG